jgi:hypothetical protein
MEQYHYLVRAHAIIAVIAFLFLLPASIMFARFYAKVPGRGVRMHMYLNILILGLSTVAFILGFMAVGPSRNLTNPHHGIGVAIYVLIIVQVLGGNWMRKKLNKKRPRRPPIKMMLHQWIGRATAILGVIQVPLGLTLYGSPKWTFILYTLWMTFLLLLYFINSYKASGVIEDIGYKSGMVIEKKKKSGGGLGKIIAPIAAGAGMAWLASRLGGREDHHRDEVIPSRHGSRRNSGSYVEDEKYEERKSGGWMKKLLAGGAAVGALALAKRWYDKRNARDDEYESVAPDTPNRRRPRVEELSDYSASEIEVRRAEHGRPPPAAIEATAAAAAISAADGGGRRPRTPEPLRTPRRHRRDSYDSDPSMASPSRREEKSHTARNAILGGMGLGGLGWLGKKFKDNKDRKEEERLDAIRRREEEDERRMEADRRRGGRPSRYTGDGYPSARAHGARRDDMTESDLSSDVTNTPIRARPGGPMPPLSAGVLPGAAAAAAAPSIIPSGSRHEIIDPVPMPSGPPRNDYMGSESVGYDSAGGGNVRRQSSRGRREAEAAAATAGAALAAAEMESRHHRDQSQGYRSGESRPAASVKMRVHDDPNRNVTLRRLTEEEAAAEREARRSSRRRRANSASSFSDADTAPSRRRYRRDALDAEIAAEKRAEAGAGGPGPEPLSPPRPAFAGGRQPKDSAYYSGPGAGGPSTAPSGLGSSPGSWSALSPGGAGEDTAERRRRRRAERSQRGGGGTTVDFT